MKPYNKIRLPVEEDLIGESEIDQEIQDRDRAIVELWTELNFIITKMLSDHHISFPRSETIMEDYSDFVAKTRAIYGL